MDMMAGEFWTIALAELDKGAALLGQALAGTSPWVTGPAIALPLLLALCSRSPSSLLPVGLLTLLAIVTARTGEASLALALYCVSVIAALNGFRERLRRKSIEKLGHDLDRVHKEMSAFLAALDRRSQAVDEMRHRLRESKPEREAS